MVKLIRDSINIPADFPPCVLTLGNFDGVHKGHQAIISKLKQMAVQAKLPTVLITFEPQPNEFFSLNKLKTPARLMRLREKLMALDGLGVDYVICLRFNKELAEMSAEEFVRDILLAKLNAKQILIGDDFRFGHKRQGDINLLQKLAPSYGFTAEAVDTFVSHGERVSSSRIRAALQEGDLITAEKLLGRPYGIAGKVVHGSKQGRILGFPTANVFPHRRAVPVEGIYVVRTYGLGPKPIPGVADVGNRPTMDGCGRTLLEVYLFDFDQMIYGKNIYVEFLQKLRNEERYDSLDALKIQIAKDVEHGRSYFSQHPESLEKNYA